MLEVEILGFLDGYLGDGHHVSRDENFLSWVLHLVVMHDGFAVKRTEQARIFLDAGHRVGDKRLRIDSRRKV